MMIGTYIHDLSGSKVEVTAEKMVYCAESGKLVKAVVIGKHPHSVAVDLGLFLDKYSREGNIR